MMQYSNVNEEKNKCVKEHLNPFVLFEAYIRHSAYAEQMMEEGNEELLEEMEKRVQALKMV